MTELTPALPKSVNKKDLLIKIRMLISQRWGIAVEYIALDSNFSDDLGLDWLDVIELIVLVEHQFPDFEVTEGGQLASLYDLIQHIQIANNETNKGAACHQEQYLHLRVVS
jgi:acyl carrier protein